ncbi:MAG TPA: rod shape-determining protein MreD [Clostridiaceae bacterium]|jgi:rod shape-determining protein MreD|nr:rod shape-determining protein MreD [Clostridiaceae bacterium]
MRMKVFIYTLGIFIIILVQTTVLDYIKINDIKPNLILVYTVCSSILEGSTGGALIGLFAGLTQDIVAGKTLGFYAILGMYLGAISGLANKMLFKDNYIVVFIFTFTLTVVYESGVYLLSGFASLRPGVLFALKRIVLPEALYNSIFSILIYYMVTKANTRLNLEGKTTRKY